MFHRILNDNLGFALFLCFFFINANSADLVDYETPSKSTGEENSDPKVIKDHLELFDTYYARWKETHQLLMDLLENAKTNKGNIHNEFVAINRMESGNKSKAFSVLCEKFPSLLLSGFPPFDGKGTTFEDKQGLIVGISTISKKIDIQMAILEKLSPDKCLITSSTSFSLNANGTRFVGLLEKCGIQSRGDGKLFKNKLTDEVTIIEDEIESVDKFLGPSYNKLEYDALQIWFGNLFYAGVTFSSLGIAFGSNTFDYDFTSTGPKWSEISFIPYSEEYFRDNCMDIFPSSEQRREFHLLSEKYSDQVPLNLWKMGLDEREVNCRKGIQNLCGNTYAIKGTRIYAYGTIGCKIREVTVNDVQNDLLSFPTEAEKLNHSKIIDTIRFCDEANNAGFSWYFVEPVLNNECKDKKR